MSANYILDEHGEPVVCTDLTRWAEWFGTDERRVVRRNTFEVNGHEVTISTVFLGLDHNWDSGPPILWETMIFGLDDDDQPQWRFTTREAAITKHDQLVAELLPTGRAWDRGQRGQWRRLDVT